jgi:lipopolysaccharide/colanic/teichoic acid biosynthesis glycosyltransferase
MVVGLLLVDLACLLLASWGGATIHAALSPHVVNHPLLMVAIMLITGGAVFAVVGLYDPRNLLDGTREFGLVVRASLYGLVAASLVVFALRSPVSREWIGFSWMLATVLVITVRAMFRQVARRLRRRGYFTRRALLVGADATAVALAAQLGRDDSGVRVVGILDDYHPLNSVLHGELTVVGRTSQLHQVAARLGAQDAIIMPQALPWETLQRLITAATVEPNGMRVHLSPGFYELLTTRVHFSERDHVPLLTVNQARLSRREVVVKTALDYTIASLVLIAFAPALLVAVVWQTLRGAHPIIERRRVAGISGAPFDLLSLRTSAPFNSALVCKAPGLLNVLAGQLAIVGPRPLHVEAAAARPAMARLRPGFTGPWREHDDPDEQARLDLYYVRAYSISLDLQVLVRRFRRHISAYRVAKRVVDIVGAAVLLVLTAPLVALSCAAVVIDSGLPVIHRRRVVGRGGREFDAFKVRTMIPDADRVLAADQVLRDTASASGKLAADPRVTRAGRWLRRTSIDELPQLVNVILGQMSLVGPRILTADELPAWGPAGELILSVRPGVTGLWQVSGRQSLSRADRIHLDGEYVRRMSLRLDLTILVRTLPAVLGGRGAY